MCKLPPPWSPPDYSPPPPSHPRPAGLGATVTLITEPRGVQSLKESWGEPSMKLGILWGSSHPRLVCVGGSIPCVGRRGGRPGPGHVWLHRVESADLGRVLASWPPGLQGVGPPRLWCSLSAEEGLSARSGLEMVFGFCDRIVCITLAVAVSSSVGHSPLPASPARPPAALAMGWLGPGGGLDGPVSESPVPATLMMSGSGLWADGRHASPAGPRSGVPAWTRGVAVRCGSRGLAV